MTFSKYKTSSIRGILGIKKDAKVTARQILEAMGGRENIFSAFHCATRLRISVNNPEK